MKGILANFSAIFRIFPDGPLWLSACYSQGQRRQSHPGRQRAGTAGPAGGFNMNGVMNPNPVPENSDFIVPNGINNLVRGAEAGLLQQVLPLLRSRSVRLDLGSVERIDAAGIAALITLYRAACSAGRHFGVTNPKPHVREILTLVGLDRFLMTEGKAQGCSPEPELAQSAA